jgi:hypothetical protein
MDSTSSPKAPSNISLIKMRLEKLEVCLVMLVNCLRSSKVLEDGSIVVNALPSGTLDFIEKALLTRN